MSTKKYLATMLILAVSGWIAFLLVLFKLEPCVSPGEVSLCHSISALSLLLFFLSLASALIGTFAGLGFLLRLWLNQQEVYLDHLHVSVRQGLLLTLCVIVALVLQLLGALTWWSGLLLVAIIILIELYVGRGD